MQVVTRRRWFDCDVYLLSLACVAVTFSLIGCAEIPVDAQKKIDGGLQATSNAAQTVASDPIFGPNVTQIAALIAAITGGLLAVNKTFEKIAETGPVPEDKKAVVTP